MSETAPAPRDPHALLVAAAQASLRELDARAVPLPLPVIPPPAPFDVFAETAREGMTHLIALAPARHLHDEDALLARAAAIDPIAWTLPPAPAPAAPSHSLHAVTWTLPPAPAAAHSPPPDRIAWVTANNMAPAATVAPASTPAVAMPPRASAPSAGGAVSGRAAARPLLRRALMPVASLAAAPPTMQARARAAWTLPARTAARVSAAVTAAGFEPYTARTLGGGR